MKTSIAGNTEDQRLTFWCPGCEMPHQPRIGGVNPWTWNGDRERPTLSPSVLVTWEYGDGREPRRCHSFVRDGRIEFLGDCTHALAGQMVDIPELPEAYV